VTTKVLAMAAALAVVATALQRKADVYGTLSSQDAEFKDLQQQVNAALALPDDPAPDAPPPPPPPAPDLSAPVAALTADMGAVKATLDALAETLPGALAPLAAVSEKLDGFEDTLGVIVASLPAAA